MLNIRFLFRSTRQVSAIRLCHNERKQLLQIKSLQESETNKESEIMLNTKPKQFGGVIPQYWSEKAAIKKEKRSKSLIKSINSTTELLRTLQRMKSFPRSLAELFYFLKNRNDRLDIIEQTYLPKRVAILRSDLAAANFIIERGGSVKFKGHQEWVGYKEEKKMWPITYVPGLFVESIKAEGTYLVYEGLQNLSNLKYLTYLSLKNLKTMNDWCMDWISKDHHMNLKHLDISGCVNVTYRALSCFYRFECLETLNVEGIPDTPEFKLACLMLLEIRPHLDIKGIDLSLPQKIEESPNEVKSILDSNKQIRELHS